jgi:putative transposase
MSRPPRITFEGGIYHIFARGNGKKTIFFDNDDRSDFLAQLEKATARYKWLCHTYCLMNNHFHLILETLLGNLSRGMQFLNSMFAQNLNKRKNSVGHVFQGRYKSILIQKEEYLLEVSRYIALNPVRAGLVSDPKDWPWSSYRAIAGLDPKHGCLHDDWILQQFHEEKSVARNMYRKFILDGIGGKNPIIEVSGQNILGNEQFVNEVSEIASIPRDLDHLQKIGRALRRPSLVELLSGLSSAKTKKSQITDAHWQHRYSMTEIADTLGIHRSTVSKMLKMTAKKK